MGFYINEKFWIFRWAYTYLKSIIVSFCSVLSTIII